MKSTVLGCGGRYFEGLEQRLPCVFERHVIELPKCLVFGRDELPQIKSPSLHGRIRRTSMTWTTLTSLIFLLIMFLMHFWSPVSSTDEPQDRPFSFQ